MSARLHAREARALLLLGSSIVAMSACEHASGYDPTRYANAPPAASVDPEIEPLPRSRKRSVRDPRGVAVVDAGALARPHEGGTVITADADAAPAPLADAVKCGTKADPCPMQRFMHGAMETAHTADRLVAAFTRVAGMSPDPAWSWVAIATRGADLANAGDIQGAKGQCQACHESYREPYKALYRAHQL